MSDRDLSGEFRAILARNRCTEHDKLIPHFGCAQSVAFAEAAGLDPKRYSEPWIEHVYDGAAALYPGCAVRSGSDMQCGWPEGAHRWVSR